MFITAPYITQAVGVASATARHPVGTIASAVSPLYGGAELIYLQGVANCALGDWVTYNADDGSTALLAANAIGPVAVSLGTVGATEYGWFQINGKAVGKCLSGFADNANVYATATAGSVDDTPVAGDRVKNAKGASAIGTPAAGLAEFEIARPFMDDALAA